MTEEHFNNVEYLNKLIGVEEKIYDIYMYFARLEKDGKQDEHRFLKLQELNDLYTLESEFLSHLPNDTLQLDELCIELEASYDEFETGNLYFSSDNEFSKDHVIERIMRQIEAYQDYLEKIEYIKEEYEDYLIDEDGEFNVNLGSIRLISFEDEVENYFGKEFYIRLQERIDSGVQDKDELIDRKYKMMFVDYFFNADVLCTGFNFKNMAKPNLETAAFELSVEKEEYELQYLEYIVDLIEETFCSMMILEQNEDDELDKRILFEVLDLQLEIAFKSLNFLSLYEMKTQLLEVLEEQGMKNSLTYVIIEENLNEAMNYVCNNDSKLSIGKGVKRLNNSFNI